MASKVFTFGTVGKTLCDALGIPNLQDVSLHFPMDNFVRAEVSFLLTVEQVEKLLRVDFTKDAAEESQRKVDQMKATLRETLKSV